MQVKATTKALLVKEGKERGLRRVCRVKREEKKGAPVGVSVVAHGESCSKDRVDFYVISVLVMLCGSDDSAAIRKVLMMWCI